MTEKEFVSYIGPLASDDMNKTGILASITAAQAILESGYGSTELATQANNLFGMKASLSGNTWPSDWDGQTYKKQTKEQDENGKEYAITADFRKYKNHAESLKDHSNYLSAAKNGSQKRYAGLIGERNYKEAATLIKAGGYATDTKYVSKLCSIIEKWDLTQYDVQKGEVKLDINKHLTGYNHNTGSVNRIKYLVIHYVGALGGALDNCKYYAGGNRNASAHYFVGFSGEIWQSVEDQNIAWHCGASSYIHPDCRNANSIGIEMCVRNKGSQADTSKDWYFEDATVDAAIELAKHLMKKYGIPADRVIRHYDVTGKICPNPYVYNTTAHTWNEFKKALTGGSTQAAPTEKKYYRVRTSWDNAKSQIGAYENLQNAINACKEGFTVYDWDGKAVHTNGTAAVPYQVKITTEDLRIRTGPGTNHDFTGQYTGKGVFTIVEEAEGSGAPIWGRLKSGAGWIGIDPSWSVRI